MQVSLVTTIRSKKKAPNSPALQQESALPRYRVTTKSGELQLKLDEPRLSLSPRPELSELRLSLRPELSEPRLSLPLRLLPLLALLPLLPPLLLPLPLANTEPDATATTIAIRVAKEFFLKLFMICLLWIEKSPGAAFFCV
jgi:hypothetical protein